MKKISIFLSSILFIVTLTTFNPSNFSINSRLFKIKEIKVKNSNILKEKNLINLFYNELLNSSLVKINKEKLNKILINNELIDYIELKKIYPSKLIVTIYEKEAIAIINDKKNKYYLIKDGEEIIFFKNATLENLPNIFGKQENFLEVYSALIQLSFPISKIKSFYYFDIGRWDIILNNNKIIKLPVNNYTLSLKNFLELEKKINFEKYSTFDYRIEDQLILN